MIEPVTVALFLSAFLKHRVEALLIGGQASIFYGAAGFSRDVDYAVLVDPDGDCLPRTSPGH